MAKTKGKKVNIRHRKILQNMVANGGKGKSMPDTMRDAGYSEAYIRSNKIKDTKSLNDLVAECMPDEKLIEKHNQLLNKEEFLGRRKTGQPHSDVKFALDMAYKLKKKYGDITIQHKFGEFSDAEIEDRIAELISGAVGLATRKGA